MPTSLSEYPVCNTRRLRLTVILLFLPLIFFGQTLTGLWTGALSNDSTSVRKDQLFEIALTEYKGKVYGYSRSEFIVNDTLYYILKRVKGTIEGDVCEVTDDEIVSYNFRGKLDKGVKVTSTFRRNKGDSTWYLAGTWKTNATKRYYSVTGKVDLEQEKDLAASKIFPHLEELKLAGDMAFYKEQNETVPIVKIARPEKVRTDYTFNNSPAPELAVNAPDLQRADADPVVPGLKQSDNVTVRTETKSISTDKTTIAVAAPDLKRADADPVLPDIRKADNALARTATKDVDENAITLKPAPGSKTASLNKQIVVKELPAENKPVTTEPVAKNTVKQPAAVPVTNTTSSAKPVQPGSTSKPVAGNTVAAINPEKKKNDPPAGPATSTVVFAPVPRPAELPKRSIEELTRNVQTIEGRKSEFSQVVEFKSDSLIIALYDNGEIDGDTVSVIMNGETIMSKQGLKASAIRKTIHLEPGKDDDFTIVLFADNLGKYPPNTGLLVVYDGADTYHLRFSSDFQKSSGIVFRRKKQP